MADPAGLQAAGLVARLLGQSIPTMTKNIIPKTGALVRRKLLARVYMFARFLRAGGGLYPASHWRRGFQPR